MNAETLHALALAVRVDMAQSETRQWLPQLVEALTNQVNNPAEPSHQQEVRDGLTALRERLAAAPSNDFTQFWRDYLHEMEIDGFLGDALLQRLDAVFAQNPITVSVARDEIQAIDTKTAEISSAIEQLMSALDYLHVSATELEPGEYEVSVTIPRVLVHNALGELGDEFAELAKLLGPLSELATGSRPALAVDSISSSEFEVVLKAAPAIVSLVSMAIKGIAIVYRKVQGIRKTQEMQRESGLPENILQQTEEYVTAQIKSGLGELADQLMSEYGANLVGQGREFEVKMDLSQSLESLAWKFDHNMRIAVRVAPPIEQTVTDAEGNESPTPEMEMYTKTIEAAREIETLDLSGDPIMMLPSPGEPEAEGGAQQIEEA